LQVIYYIILYINVFLICRQSGKFYDKIQRSLHLCVVVYVVCGTAFGTSILQVVVKVFACTKLNVTKNNNTFCV